MKIYLICPVRNASETVTAVLKGYVTELESQGHKVYWPTRDAPQDDSSGTDIVKSELTAIDDADEVYIYWDKKSYGSHFDLGAAMILRKPLTLVNAPPDIELKSYLKVIKHTIEHGYDGFKDNGVSYFRPRRRIKRKKR